MLWRGMLHFQNTQLRVNKKHTAWNKTNQTEARNWKKDILAPFAFNKFKPEQLANQTSRISLF